MNILVAVREQELIEVTSVLEDIGEAVSIIKTLSLLDRNVIENINFALVDEDFDGPQTGWILATEIRKAEHSSKIVMIVRKNATHDQLPLYDVTIGFPITVDELIAEIKQK